MAISFITSLTADEFKTFLKQALLEIQEENSGKNQPSFPEVLDAQQAADFLRLKLTTVYEKTSQKILPHFKRGHKLYFHRSDLENWVKAGKVSTVDELKGLAASFIMEKMPVRNTSKVR